MSLLGAGCSLISSVVSVYETGTVEVAFFTRSLLPTSAAYPPLLLLVLPLLLEELPDKEDEDEDEGFEDEDEEEEDEDEDDEDCFSGEERCSGSMCVGPGTAGSICCEEDCEDEEEEKDADLCGCK